MPLARKNLCPLLKKKCMELDCAWFVEVKGQDPSDKDKIISDWGCAVMWQVTGLLAVAKHTGQGLTGVQAAVESMRNETVTTRDVNSVQMAALTNGIVKAVQDAPARLNGDNAKLINQQ